MGYARVADQCGNFLWFVYPVLHLLFYPRGWLLDRSGRFAGLLAGTARGQSWQPTRLLLLGVQVPVYEYLPALGAILALFLVAVRKVLSIPAAEIPTVDRLKKIGSMKMKMAWMKR